MPSPNRLLLSMSSPGTRMAMPGLPRTPGQPRIDQAGLDDIVTRLRTVDHNQRTAAIHKLTDTLSQTAREREPDEFALELHGLSSRIYALASSGKVEEAYAAIGIIDGVLASHLKLKLSLPSGLPIKYLGFLVRAAFGCGNAKVVSHGAAVYGRLAAACGPEVFPHVQTVCRNAIEALQSGQRNDTRRLSGVIVLRELAKTCPAAITREAPLLLDLLFVGLWDPNVTIRKASAGAVAGALAMQADTEAWRESSIAFARQALVGLKSDSLETIHGSLLALKELYAFSDPPDYAETCRCILELKDRADVDIRAAVLSLLPVLAATNPQHFQSQCLEQAMRYFSAALGRRNERDLALVAVCRTAESVGADIMPFIDPVIKTIVDALSPAHRSTAAVPSILQAITLLVKAIGPDLELALVDLCDLVLKLPLSEPLIDAFIEISKADAVLAMQIQLRLLDLIAQILVGVSFDRIALTVPSSITSLALSGPTAPADQVILALKTLQMFDFAGASCDLSLLADAGVSPLLRDQDADIRSAAAQTLAGVVDKMARNGSRAQRLDQDTATSLLSLALSDPGACVRSTHLTRAERSVREAVLASLPRSFDQDLARSELVEALGQTLNDESRAVQDSALRILIRIQSLNPAQIEPMLRLELIELLTAIEHAPTARARQQCASMLTIFIAGSPQLSTPLARAIGNTLLPRARDSDRGSSFAIVAALTELVRAVGTRLDPVLDDLTQLGIDLLADTTNTDGRFIGLRMLSRLASHAERALTPYVSHPTLLPMLTTIIQSDPSPLLRRAAVKTLARLGALDPFELATSPSAVDASIDPVLADANHPLSVGPSHEGASDCRHELMRPDYHLTLVLTTLVSVLRDSSLEAQHAWALDAVLTVFRSLRTRCTPFLPQLMPAVLSAVRAQTAALELIKIIGQHVRPYVLAVLEIVDQIWRTSSLQPLTIDLIDALATALGGGFRDHVSATLPKLIEVFTTTYEGSQALSMHRRGFRCLTSMSLNLEDHLGVILPSVYELLNDDVDDSTRQHALSCLLSLIHSASFRLHISRTTRSIVKLLQTCDDALISPAMDVLEALLCQSGQAYMLYLETVEEVRLSILATLRTQVCRDRGISHAGFEQASELLRQGRLPVLNDPPPRTASNETATLDPVGVETGWKQPTHTAVLREALHLQHWIRADDWKAWIKRFSCALLRASPQHALRSCAQFAETYTPVARELFNGAFAAVYVDLNATQQNELATVIETVMTLDTVPTDIVQTLLNLCEFMERNDKLLPIGLATLGRVADRCHSYAKSLHYKELEMLTHPTPATLDDLMTTNQHLQQPDAAIGMLSYASQVYGLEKVNAEWYERLGQWEDALALYDHQAQTIKPTFSSQVGRMRCLDALGEWETLSEVARAAWIGADQSMQQHIAPLAASAAAGRGVWSEIAQYLPALADNKLEHAWYSSLLATHLNERTAARAHIAVTRDLLEREATTLLNESYNRAYPVLVRMQMVGEVEEVMAYQQAGSDDNHPLARREGLKRTWRRRIQGCQQDVDVWQPLLVVRQLVLDVHDDAETFVKFANLARRNGRYAIAQRVLDALLRIHTLEDGTVVGFSGMEQSAYAFCKLEWAEGRRDEAMSHVQELIASLSADLGLSVDFTHDTDAKIKSVVRRHPDKARILERSYHRMGVMQAGIIDSWDSLLAPDVIRSHTSATKLGEWSKPWHGWAVAASEQALRYINTLPPDSVIPEKVFIDKMVPAIRAFFKAISLSPSSSSIALQDVLRLLNLLYAFGFDSSVAKAVSDGLSSVAVSTWLPVVPQLMARLWSSSSNVRHIIHAILVDLGKQHPSSLIYSLVVASEHSARRRPAASLLDILRRHNPIMVSQATIVVKELVRVAILWQERWQEGLEDASRQFYGNRDIDKMFSQLDSLYVLLDAGPATLREINFVQAYGDDLLDARKLTDRYREHADETALRRAWDIYYAVFRRLTASLQGGNMSSLDLSSCSPDLLKLQDLELVVPGTFDETRASVTISSFHRTLEVLSSKQRPRKLKMKGSDGSDYTFLLKGHEDIRQDERVQQFFSLTNRLLHKDRETLKRRLNIQTYAAIPLSLNTGLLSWVPACDTMHVLLRNYRARRGILFDVELRLMLSQYKQYDRLTTMQKIEVFEHALENTSGQDLYRILWLKSRDCEAWLERRTTFTRSLAVMSMVGHTIGLGDRHPSNLLINRVTGQVVHIDFGDCFEVAMQRERFPEGVPFRLTRMMVQAMELGGPDGTFRISAEHTMRVLRSSDKSLMALLEAFLWEPLLQWRLLEKKDEEVKRRTSSPLSYEAAGIVRQPRRSSVEDSSMPASAGDGLAEEDTATLDERAIEVLERVQKKLNGREFDRDVQLSVEDQVDRLIAQARDHTNLAVLWLGYCAFW